MDHFNFQRYLANQQFRYTTTLQTIQLVSPLCGIANIGLHLKKHTERILFH